MEHDNDVFYGDYVDNDPYIQDYDWNYTTMRRTTAGGMDMTITPTMTNGGMMMSTCMMAMDTTGEKKQNGLKTNRPLTLQLPLWTMKMEKTRMELL